MTTAARVSIAHYWTGLFRYWVRLGLGVLLSLFLGHEVMGYGLALIVEPVALFGVLILYLFIVSVTDDLVARFDLTDRDLLLVGAVGAIVLGGIGNQELHESDPEAWLVTFLGVNLVTFAFNTLAWGVYLIWTMHLLQWLLPRRGRSSVIGWRGWVGNSLLLAFLVLNYVGNNARPERLGTDLVLFVAALGFVAWLVRRVRRRSPDRREEIRRREVERNRAIIWMAGSFIILSLLVVIMWGAQPIPLNLLVTAFIYIPATLVVLARRRLAV